MDLIETLLGEEAVVPEWALRIFGEWMEGRQDRISKAAVVRIIDVDDRMFLLAEERELPELEARERDALDHLDVRLSSNTIP